MPGISFSVHLADYKLHLHRVVDPHPSGRAAGDKHLKCGKGICCSPGDTCEKVKDGRR